MKAKKAAAVALSAAMALGTMIVPVQAEEATGKVYYYNFAPEVADQWVALGEGLHRGDRRSRRSCHRSFRNL